MLLLDNKSSVFNLDGAGQPWCNIWPSCCGFKASNDKGVKFSQVSKQWGAFLEQVHGQKLSVLKLKENEK